MEKWKSIKGYEEQYMVSNYGRIKNIKTGRIRKFSIINSGYQMFQLRGRNHSKSPRHRELVHVIVAKHFVKGYKKGLEVNHKDGNRLNNEAYNLEWVTRKENIQDTIKRGTHNVSKAQEKAKIVNCKKVAQYDMLGNWIKNYTSAKEASKEIGVNVKRAAAGTRKSAGGYLWEYVG